MHRDNPDLPTTDPDPDPPRVVWLRARDAETAPAILSAFRIHDLRDEGTGDFTALLDPGPDLLLCGQSIEDGVPPRFVRYALDGPADDFGRLRFLVVSGSRADVHGALPETVAKPLRELRRLGLLSGRLPTDREIEEGYGPAPDLWRAVVAASAGHVAAALSVSRRDLRT